MAEDKQLDLSAPCDSRDVVTVIVYDDGSASVETHTRDMENGIFVALEAEQLAILRKWLVAAAPGEPDGMDCD